MPTITVHIRRPLRKAGGNQFYRDKSNRGQGTFCGAPETIYDLSCRDTIKRWTNPQTGNEHVACLACIETRKGE